MFTWPHLILFCAISMGLGNLIDFVLRKNEREWLRDRMVDLWMRLSEHEGVNLAERMANLTLQAHEKILGHRFLGPRSILVTLALSMPLTCLALFLGRLLEVKDHLSVSDSLRNTLVALRPFTGFHNSQYLLPINYVFDFLTVITTIFILERILSRRGFAQRLLLISADLMIAITYSMATLAIVKINTAMVRYDVELSANLIGTSIHSAVGVYAGLAFGIIEEFDALFFSLTNLLPTAAYFAVLITLIGVDSINDLFRRLMIRAIERLDENPDRTVFSRFAALLSYLGVLMKASLSVAGIG